MLKVYGYIDGHSTSGVVLALEQALPPRPSMSVVELFSIAANGVLKSR